jgi:phosphatidylglycerophosphatase A
MSSGRERLYLAIGSALGLGLLPVAPGSFAALFGVAAHVAVVYFLPSGWHWPALLALLLAISWANHVLTPWAVRYWNDEDPRHFVLDEIAGYLVVPLVFPGGSLFQVASIGFLLFRVLDIIKVPPARQLDRDLHGSWGILLDDIVSGSYAALLMHVGAALGYLAKPSWTPF